MSSNFPGGSHQDYFNINTNNIPSRSISMMNNLSNNHPQNLFRSPLAGILTDPSSQMGLRRPDLIGKRSLAEFQQHQQQLQLQQQASFFLRNVKQRPYNNNNNSNNLMDFPSSSDISCVSNNSSSLASSISSIPRYGVPVMQQNIHQLNNAQSVQSLQSFNLGVMGNYQNNIRRGYSRVSNVSLPNNINNNLLGNEIKNEKNQNSSEGKMMMKQLQELEKQLLLDDDEDGENDQNNVSGVTNSEWSETIQTILCSSNPVIVTKQSPDKPENIVSPSPTSSSSSSCASSSATSVSPIPLLTDAAGAISDGKSDTAVEILTRLTNVSNARGTPEQRLSFYMTEALRTRLNSIPATTGELYGKDHILSTQLLYEKSPCFNLAFVAANATILEAGKRIHVVDFDIGQGLQYIYLLQEIAAAREECCEARESKKVIPFSIKLSTFQDFGTGGVERLKNVGERLKSLANKLGVMFSFNILNLKLCDLDTTSLKGGEDEVLVVNLAFTLYKLPDESVTTENLRDEVLRRVKGLSPALVIIIEQELNGNTASFETRVGQACGYYGALLESLDATTGSDNSDRVKIEEGLSRKMMNSVACEGRDRVERCEVFGKWRARMGMARFESNAMSQLSHGSFVNLVNSVTRGNPGFTVKEEGGGVSLGWMGRILTVVSAWH
uniref:scarecrow-like protein 8 n=1 Tax=Erigeron canadensis TaxID=72917 RepID=UPI001CB950B7|nr:scarecrow-like protein 8 [Erigeron canadensis]